VPRPYAGLRTPTRHSHLRSPDALGYVVFCPTGPAPGGPNPGELTGMADVPPNNHSFLQSADHNP